MLVQTQGNLSLAGYLLPVKFPTIVRPLVSVKETMETGDSKFFATIQMPEHCINSILQKEKELARVFRRKAQRQLIHTNVIRYIGSYSFLCILYYLLQCTRVGLCLLCVIKRKRVRQSVSQSVNINVVFYFLSLVL